MDEDAATRVQRVRVHTRGKGKRGNRRTGCTGRDEEARGFSEEGQRPAYQESKEMEKEKRGRIPLCLHGQVQPPALSLSLPLFPSARLSSTPRGFVFH